ncbi:MAG: DUF2273 domain-containing protein [bacterium]|jgi:uncharacterized membrane protein
MPDLWIEFLIRHGGKILFTCLGLVFGLVVLSKGFFAAIFLLLCLAVGYFVGKQVDEGENLSWLWEKIFPSR